MNGVVFRHGSEALMNWGRWVLPCGRPGCLSALEVKPPQPPVFDQNGVAWFHPTWGDTSMRCWDCGWTTEHLGWPVDPFAIEAILLQRPDEKTRNWLPGETLDMLLMENVLHGIMPPVPENGSDGQIMVTCDDVLIGGSLMSALPEHEAIQRLREIEG